MELPADLAGYGEERLGKLEVGDLRSECARRGLDVKPQAQKNTCIKLLLEWKAAQGGPKAQGLPFDLAHYGTKNSGPAANDEKQRQRFKKEHDAPLALVKTFLSLPAFR